MLLALPGEFMEDVSCSNGCLGEQHRWGRVISVDEGLPGFVALFKCWSLKANNGQVCIQAAAQPLRNLVRVAAGGEGVEARHTC